MDIYYCLLEGSLDVVSYLALRAFETDVAVRPPRESLLFKAISSRKVERHHEDGGGGGDKSDSCSKDGDEDEDHDDDDGDTHLEASGRVQQRGEESKTCVRRQRHSPITSKDLQFQTTKVPSIKTESDKQSQQQYQQA